jgi:hypothetical protein
VRPEPSTVSIEAFTRRVFVCHHCGADGREDRDTDAVDPPVRYRLGSDQLLLPHCSRCRDDLGETGRWDAAMRLVLALVSDTLAWVDITPLSTYTCSVPECRKAWHHLGGPLPYRPVRDPGPTAPDHTWHPCPWCVGDDVAVATTAHHERDSARRSLDRWERQLAVPRRD